jgi:Flp pilus assembly protein TadD
MYGQGGKNWVSVALCLMFVLLGTVNGPRVAIAQGTLSEKEQQMVKAQATMMVAEELYDHEEYDKAIEQWREAIRLDPGLVKAYIGLGIALRGKGQLAEAISLLREAVRLDPKNGSVQADLGDALRERGDVDEAIAAYRRAKTLVPNSAIVSSNLGYLLVHKGDLDGAIAEWREATRVDPKYAPPYVNLGEALEKKGDKQGAIAAYERFLELEPHVSFAAEIRKEVETLKAGSVSKP